MSLEEHGWAVVPGVDVETADAWAKGILTAVAEGHAIRIDREPGAPVLLDEGGARHHWVLPVGPLLAACPGLDAWYGSATGLLSRLWGRTVIPSPHAASALTGKVYEPGDCHGPHRDTNPVTALLCLTETGSWGTNLTQRDGTVVQVWTDPGDLVVFHGRTLRHWVPALPAHVPPRVTIPANYYHPDDTWRPEGTDALVYGGADA